jgi:hypothetical protein
MKRLISSLVLGVVAAACLSGCSRVPEILWGATAGSGLYGACGWTQDEKQSEALAVSPEFNERLARQFPPGSDEQRLMGTLTAVGFRSIGTCDDDKSIRILRYEGRVVLAMTADVYCRADSHGKILWTKGFVEYEGL